MLQANELRKAYDDVQAVDGISLRVEAGRIVGLLGPNGAGKTTTVSMLAGLLAPDEGEVLLDGRPLHGDTDPGKRLLGLVPQEIALYEKLSALDNLRFIGSLYGLSGRELDGAVRRALESADLVDRARHRVKTFSGGMKRRLNLAAGLLHGPTVLLLDEPTVGVDPQSRNAIFENLEKLRDQGMALLYTTHYMEEAERLCDRVIIVDHGRVIAEDSPRALCRALPGGNRLRIELAESRRRMDLESLRSVPGVTSVSLEDGVLTIGLENVTTGAPAVLSRLEAMAIPYTSLSTERANLETVFLALTGRSLRDG